MIIEPKSVVLTSQVRTVSPRSALSSDKYNDFVNETGSDLRNLKVQLNRVLDTITTGTDSDKVWDSSDPDDNHGLDAISLYWDSTITPPESIKAHVEDIKTTLEAKITNTNQANDISFAPPSGWETYTDVQVALTQAITKVDNVSGLVPEWTDNSGVLHPKDSSGTQTVVIGGTNTSNSDIVLNGTNGNITTTGNIIAVSFAGSGASLTNISLTGLSDTVTTGKAEGHVLIYDGTNSWDTKAISGDVTITKEGVITVDAGAITNAQLAGSIVNAKLVNDSVSYGGISLDLGESDATPAFNLVDATNYPTTALSGTITNAQLAGSIVNTKLVNDAVTVTAGSALTGGGSIALGGSTILNVGVDGATIEISGDALRLKVDGIKDTHIDWGTSSGQISTDDMPVGSTNLYYTDSLAQANRLDEMAAPTGSVSMNSQRITNVADGTGTNDVINKSQLDSHSHDSSYAAKASGNTSANEINCTEDDSGNVNNNIVFVADGSGAQGAKTDDDFHYNPSTGKVTAAKFVGDGALLTGISGAGEWTEDASGVLYPSRTVVIGGTTTANSDIVLNETNGNITTVGAITGASLEVGDITQVAASTLNIPGGVGTTTTDVGNPGTIDFGGTAASWHTPGAIKRLGTISFDWQEQGNTQYDYPHEHGITSKSEDNFWTDDLKISSFGNLVLVIDSNDNSASTFKIVSGSHDGGTSGNRIEMFKITEAGDTTITGKVDASYFTADEGTDATDGYGFSTSNTDPSILGIQYNTTQGNLEINSDRGINLYLDKDQQTTGSVSNFQILGINPSGGNPRTAFKVDEVGLAYISGDLHLAAGIGDGHIGVGISPNSSYPIYTSAGAYVTTGGVWTDASSRSVKKNIKNLSQKDADAAFAMLNPKKFEYKAGGEEHLGFIAEDVHDLVASEDRKGLSPMDIVAVLTKVMQKQSKTLNKQNKTLDKQSEALSKQQKQIGKLERALRAKK